MRPPYVTFSTKDNFDEVFEEVKRMRDEARQEGVKTRLQGLEISGDEAEKIRRDVESNYRIGSKGGVIPFNEEDDNRRILITLESLFSVGEGFSFVVSSKPETPSCEEASKHRPNLSRIRVGEFFANRQLGEEESKETSIEDGIGASTDREVKSILYKNSRGGVFYFIIPGNEALGDGVIGNKGIVGKGGFLDLASCGVVPYTLNPATAKEALKEYRNQNASKLRREEVNVFVHDSLKNSTYLTNNLGSRHLSLTITGDHFENTIFGLYPEHRTYQNEEELIRQIGELNKIQDEQNKKNSEANGRGGRDRKNSGRSKNEQDQKKPEAESKGSEEMIPTRAPSPTGFHQPAKTNEVSNEK